MFKELGLTSDQIFIHSKGGNKKGTGSSKRQDGDCEVRKFFSDQSLTPDSIEVSMYVLNKASIFIYCTHNHTLNFTFVQLIDGFDSHYLLLKSSPPRPAAVSVRGIVGELTFNFPVSLSKINSSASSPRVKSRRPRSSSAPKQERKSST